MIGETAIESDETFFLNLSAPVNATIADAQGVATIVNDDVAVLSISNASVTEGNTVAATATFTVTMSPVSPQTVTVNYATANGSAVAPGDYTAKSGTLTFAPGTTSQTIPVTVSGDTIDELDETFVVNLSAPVNAVIATGQGIGTIVDNDPAPSLAINNATVPEGDTGTVNAVFTVTLSTASGKTVTVNYATANGTATTPADYVASSGALTFAPGATSQTVTVAVAGDVFDEPNETFTVTLSGAVNATISDSQGVGTINDDDPTPCCHRQRDGDRGELGHRQCRLYRDAGTGQPSSRNGELLDVSGSASSTTDYTSASGTLTFPVGTTISRSPWW